MPVKRNNLNLKRKLYLQEISLQQKGYIFQRWKIYHANGVWKKVVLISSSIDFKVKSITTDKEGHFIIESTIKQEVVTVLNLSVSSVAQLCPTPCPSPTCRACSNSCPSNWWCHPTFSSSVFLFAYCLQSFPAPGSFRMSQFFPLNGQSIWVSASTSVLPMNIQAGFPLGLIGWIS